MAALSAVVDARDTTPHAGFFLPDTRRGQWGAISKTLRIVAVAVSSGGHVEWLGACDGLEMLVTRPRDDHLSTGWQVYP